jgi:DNA primase
MSNDTTTLQFEKLLKLQHLGILKKTRISGNELLACCPFHEDSNPSWGINLETGKSNCFSCGVATGSWPQFWRLILKNYNIDLRDDDNTPPPTRLQVLKSKFSKIISHSKNLPNTPAPGTPGMLEKSDLSRYFDLANQFQDDLDDYIESRVPNHWVLEKFNVMFSKKKNQYLFPIKSGNKKLVGWCIRTFSEPRYLYNTGFKKNQVLFGVDHLVDLVPHLPATPLIITEGPFDVMRTHANGYPNVVGLLGMHPSKNQVKLISQLTDTAVIALDNDSAGQKGTQILLKELEILLGKKNVRLFDWSKVASGKKDLGDLTQEELELGLCTS